MLYVVEVGVATSRPPKVDATVYFLMEGRDRQDAEQAACQMACLCRPWIVFAVCSRSIDKVLYDHYGWD